MPKIKAAQLGPWVRPKQKAAQAKAGVYIGQRCSAGPSKFPLLFSILLSLSLESFPLSFNLMVDRFLWKFLHWNRRDSEEMPLFISDEEYSRCSNDVALVAEKADSFIRDLYNELQTVKAQADAASITAEQTCSLLEQKYISLSQEFSKLESQNAQLNSSLQERLSELAQIQAEKHQLHLKSVIFSFLYLYIHFCVFVLYSWFVCFGVCRLRKMERLSGCLLRSRSFINRKGSCLSCWSTRIWRLVRKMLQSKVTWIRLWVAILLFALVFCFIWWSDVMCCICSLVAHYVIAWAMRKCIFLKEAEERKRKKKKKRSLVWDRWHDAMNCFVD